MWEDRVGNALELFTTLRRTKAERGSDLESNDLYLVTVQAQLQHIGIYEAGVL